MDGKESSYGRVSIEYEEVLVPARLLAPALSLIERLALGPADSLLDVGTGTGVMLDQSRSLSTGTTRLFGIDPSQEMLRVARSKGHSLLAQARLPNLPFGSATFDVVSGGFVLSHIKQPRQALAEIARVLKPGGRLGLSGWGPAANNFIVIWNEVFDTLVDLEQLAALVKDELPGEAELEDPSTLAQELTLAGFEEVALLEIAYVASQRIREFIACRSVMIASRIARKIVGQKKWGEFCLEVEERLALRFPEPLEYDVNVNFALAVLPQRKSWPARAD